MASGEPFTLAGLWENWKDPPSGEWIRTFTIITTEANDLVRELHDRMPVVIGADDRERWLNGSDPQELLQSYPSELMRMWPVSTRVNSPKNDDPSLLDRVEDQAAPSSGSEVKRVNEAEGHEP